MTRHVLRDRETDPVVKAADMRRFRRMTQAEIEEWVDKEVVTLAGTRRVIKELALEVLAQRRRDRQ